MVFTTGVPGADAGSAELRLHDRRDGSSCSSSGGVGSSAASPRLPVSDGARTRLRTPRRRRSTGSEAGLSNALHDHGSANVPLAPDVHARKVAKRASHHRGTRAGRHERPPCLAARRLASDVDRGPACHSTYVLAGPAEVPVIVTPPPLVSIFAMLDALGRLAQLVERPLYTR
jgi:hypothetical protein